MKKKLSWLVPSVLLALLVMAPVVAQNVFGYNTITAEWLINSLIDATPIGNTTPSSGKFTTVTASGGYVGNLTGNVTGNVSGSAASATTAGSATTATTATTAGALTSTPTNCGVHRPAYGISANGNALCTNTTSYFEQIDMITSGICSTGAGAYATCNTTGTWTTSFADANYSLVCTTFTPTSGTATNPVFTTTILSQSASGFVLQSQTGGTSGSEGITTTAQINCTGTHL